ncbi:MAG: restriction endonuclease [Planctomycetes bacterium]|nr:restriction endonuclease [Planctomycetota bacterium]
MANQYFTRSAKELAQSSNVDLIDRQDLIEMIQDFNRSPKDYSLLASLFSSQSEAAASSSQSASLGKPPPRTA